MGKVDKTREMGSTQKIDNDYCAGYRVSGLANLQLLPDRPIDSITELDDELKLFTKSFCSLVRGELNSDAPAIRSFLLAGDWGTGKTSVLHSVRNTISTDENVKVVFFEAWRYEYESSLLVALVWAIARATGAKDLDGNSAVEKLFDSAISILFKYTTKSSFKSVQDDVKVLEVDKRVEKYSELLSEYTNTDQFIIAFHNMIAEHFPEKKLLILIDDLDRCSPESSLELLEHLRRLINITDDSDNSLEQLDSKRSNSYFLVAMDKTTLKQAIQHKFADLSSYDSNRYLEKLFPVTLQLPTICKFDTSQLDSVYLYLRLLSQEKIAFESEIKSVFRQPFFKNSRLLIRCINQVKIVVLFFYERQLINSEENGEKNTESNHNVEDQIEQESFKQAIQRLITPQLFEWLAAINRWPELRRFVSSKDDNFWETVELYLIGKAENIGSGLASLESLVSKGEYKELLEHPNIREFLAASEAFGSIHNEKTLPKKITEYKKCDEILRQFGL